MSQKTWMIFTIFLLMLSFGLAGLACFQFATRSPGEHFEYLPTGEVAKIIALERPNVSTKALLSWATLAATATFSFDFVNVNDQIAAIKNYFTSDGFSNYLASLNETGMLTTIQEKKLVLTAVAIGPAIVLTEEERGNKHSWRIQVPILVRYQSANVDETRQHLIEMLVTQVPTQDAPKGIGIAQYIVREAGPEASV